MVFEINKIFKIDNTWLSFHYDIKKSFHILHKNLFPKYVDQYLHNALNSSCLIETHPVSDTNSKKKQYLY